MSQRRRRSRKRGAATKRSARPSGDPRTVLADAFAAHREGDIARAERLYKRALEAQPDNAEAHYLYGMLDHHRGNYERALGRFDTALGLNPDHFACRNHRAEALAALGRLEDAEAALRSALRVEPGSPQLLNNLGNVLADRGRLGEAVEAYRAAAAAAPDFAEPHANLGAALARLGELDDARAACERALALVPDHGQALANLGGVLAELGQAREATKRYERALMLMPDDPRIRVALASVLGTQGPVGEAVGHLLAVLEADPGDGEALSAAAGLLADAPDLEHGPATRALLSLCLVSDLVAPEEIARPAARAISARHGLPSDPKSAFTVDLPADLVERLAADDVACGMLVRCVNVDPALEIVLTRLRRGLLQDGIGPASERFAASLAAQCLLNEFVFEVTEDEAAAVSSLARTIERACTDEGFPDDPACNDVLAYALYAPLSALGCAEALAEMPLERWPQKLQPIVAAALVDWRAERAIAAELPTIGAVSDPVSEKVAAQYEDNPYPRWRAAVSEAPESVAQVFAWQFPRQPVPDALTGGLDVLVAGCGTGRHPIASVAQRYEDCQVLAVDLSRASLAYAARNAREMAVGNIEFAQADILQLGTLERRFHLIECAGVLHHMADPLEGWQVLRDLLVPGGVMVIGLYAARARAAIVAARARIGALELDGSPAGIRAYRKRLLLGEEDEALSSLLDWPDFYSTSGCRDLLFHVQEHRFTLPRIAEALETLKLEFIGFEHDDPAFWRRYRAHAPHDPAGVDLAAWDRLEAKHPDMFAGMYQFWCRRTDG